MSTKRVIETVTGERFTFENARMARYGVCQRVPCPTNPDRPGAWFRSEKTGRTYLAAAPGYRVDLATGGTNDV